MCIFLEIGKIGKLGSMLYFIVRLRKGNWRSREGGSSLKEKNINKIKFLVYFVKGKRNVLRVSF